MENLHSIADLLNGGVEPTPAEVADLTALGRFVNRLLARHIGGEFQTLLQGSIGVQAERMGARFSDAGRGFPLAAETGTRWERPMGIGAAMLEPMTGRYWQPDTPPRLMASLMAELAELTTVALPEVTADGYRGPEPGLTGPKGRRSRSLFGPAAPPVALPRAMAWAGTGEVAPATLAALSAGGLPLADQLRVAEPPDARRPPVTSVVLDGMTVDHRTPALTAALLQSTDMVSDRGLSGEIASRHEIPETRESGGPIYGLYDAAEATFVGLADVDPGEISRAQRAPSPRTSPGSSRVSLDQVVPVPRLHKAEASRRPTPLRSWTGGQPKITGAPGAPVLVASQVTHDHQGRSVPVTTRGGIAGEQVQVVRLDPSPVSPALVPSLRTGFEGADRASETVGVTMTSAAARASEDSGPDRRAAAEEPGSPLGDVGERVSLPARDLRAPSSPPDGFVAELEERRWQGAPAAEHFRPLAAGPARTPTLERLATPGALDEGIWITLSEEDPGADATTDGIPEERTQPLRRGAAEHVRSAATGVRTALQRPVITAREVLAAAPWVASLARASARAAPERTALPALVQWMEDRREKLGPSAQLGDLTVRTELAHLISTAPSPLVRQLQVAGWTQPEIARVLLALPDTPPAADTVDEPTSTSSGAAERGQAHPGGAPVQDTGRMARSLARILTGTEALSAPPTLSAPSEPDTEPASYFGASAPSRSAVATTGLREAIGELLALAQRSIGALGPQPVKEQETARAHLSRVIGRMSQVADIPVRAGYVDASREQRTWVDLSAHQEPTTLAARLTTALEASGRGPAGIERLAAALSTRGGAGIGFEGLGAPVSAADVGLAATLAPDAMLHGLTARRARGVSQGRRSSGTLIGLGYEEGLPSGGRHRGLADFSGSWLRRVDGTRVGLDLGMDDTRAAFQETFAGLGTPSDAAQMGLAATSPIDDVSVVVPGGTPGEGAQRGSRERSPDRRGRPRGATTTSRATSSAQRADWGWVNTSSGVTAQPETAAMMQGLSDARPGVGSEAMPLIAPSMHAVSQAAMRSANAEDAPGQQTAPVVPQGKEAGAAQESQAPLELSKGAFEELATRMAERISRRMRRDKDRRGQWT